VTQDIRICFVGDSLVNGTGDESALGWAGRLCAAAASRHGGVTYYNLGIRRDTCRDVLRRWKPECTLRLPEGCDGRLVVSCGVNDTVLERGRPRVALDESVANIHELLLAAHSYKTLVVGPPPVDDTEQNGRIQRLSEAFAQMSEGIGVAYIELYSALLHDNAYRQEVASNDGAHPRSGGYARIASIIASSPGWWFSEKGEKG
jgi:acyl-CoA thioesterase-1